MSPHDALLLSSNSYSGMKNHQLFLSHRCSPQIVTGTILHRHHDDPSSQVIADVAELTMGWFGGYWDHYLVQEGCLVGAAAAVVL
jgi:hypothetical protein